MKPPLLTTCLLLTAFRAWGQEECASRYSKYQLSALSLQALGQECQRVQPAVAHCPSILDETSYLRWLLAEVATRLNGQPQAVVLGTLGPPDRQYRKCATCDPFGDIEYYWRYQLPSGDYMSYRLEFQRTPSGVMENIWHERPD